MFIAKSKIQPVWNSDKSKSGKGKGKGKSIDGKDLGKNNPQNNEGEGGKEDEPQDNQGGGEGQDGEGSDNSDSTNSDGTAKKGKIQKVTNNGSNGERMADDEATATEVTEKIHDMAKKSGLSQSADSASSSLGDVIKSASEQGDKLAQERGQQNGMGGWGTEGAKNYLNGLFKVDAFPEILSLIKRKLNKFKSLFTDDRTTEKSVVMRRYNPGAYAIHGEISVNTPVTEQNEFEVPLLFIAIDTSGSMSDTEVKLAVSLLNTAAQHFKVNGSYPGKIIRIFFDSTVQLPLVPWKPISDGDLPHAKVDRQGYGGTDFNALLACLDDIFVSSQNGRDYFVYNEDSIAFKISGYVGLDANGSTHNWNVKGNKTADGNIEYDGKTFAVADLPYATYKPHSKVIRAPLKNVKKKVPFLICVTDGGFNAEANISASKLYSNSSDNILYVLVGGKERNYLVPNDDKHVVLLQGPEDSRGQNEAVITNFLGKMFEELN